MEEEAWFSGLICRCTLIVCVEPSFWPPSPFLMPFELDAQSGVCVCLQPENLSVISYQLFVQREQLVRIKLLQLITAASEHGWSE